MEFKNQIQEIFGTTHIHKLQQISKDADSYRYLQSDINCVSEKKRTSGRKNSFTEEQIAHIIHRCIFYFAEINNCPRIFPSVRCRSLVPACFGELDLLPIHSLWDILE